MAKYRIFTVGFDLPGDEFEYIDFDSDATLLDADVILFEPTLGCFFSNETYNGQKLLNKESSFKVKQRLDHWRSEIVAAVNSGKLVIIYLVKPIIGYRYTGEKQHSGTGRSRVTTNMVTEISSFEAVPNLKSVVAKTGTEMQLDRDARNFATYWSEFSDISQYQAEITGDFKNIIIRSRSGDRILGARISNSDGNLIFLPPLQFDREIFTHEDDETGEILWNRNALQFGKKLATTLKALTISFKKDGQATPPPTWTSDPSFIIASEIGLENQILKCSSEIVKLEKERSSLEEKRLRAGILRNLLFEQGKPLEIVIIESLRLFGFEAQQFKDGGSEFDSVFSCPEGRCLGEAEGKDNKAINIDKFSQLERNLQEDFAREDVHDYAKGVLFGNGFRLIPLTERGNFFTEKCIAAAKRIGAALVKTPDLFLPAKYLQENPHNTDYAKQCRQAILETKGEVVKFPLPPNP